MAKDDLAISGVDATTPNVARIYDYFLGGEQNYAADRQLAEQLLVDFPWARQSARANREFLGRAVRFLAQEQGIRQYLDIGTGLPTQDSVHEVVQPAIPDANIVYVDNDQEVLAHGRSLLLANQDRVAMVHGDLRDPTEILTQDDVRRLINFDEPVAILLVAILHFIKDQESPHDLVRVLRDAMAPGSYLVLTHAMRLEQSPDDLISAADRAYRSATAQLALRSPDEVISFFDGMEIIAPGLVDTFDWRPDSNTTAADVPTGFFACVGCKRSA